MTIVAAEPLFFILVAYLGYRVIRRLRAPRGLGGERSRTSRAEWMVLAAAVALAVGVGATLVLSDRG
ncbi:MAG: hypothetical protein JWQ39_2183 [Glaciihabitans sp.]|nr:hypothetical protein [Glaciihabitans sp.]